MFTFKWREAEFANQILNLQRVTQRALADVVKDEARLFVQDAIKMTPPFGSSPNQESFASQKRVGEAAVKRDLGRSFTILDPSKIRDRRVRKDLEKAARKGDMETVKRLLLYCKIPVNSVLREATAAEHAKLRDKRGRVQKWQKVWVLRTQSVGRVLRAARSHIGRGKAGWMEAAKALGVKVPDWISRHVSSPGRVQDLTKGTDKPRIIVSNEVPFIQEAGADLRIVNRAMANRIRNIKVKIEKAVRAGWKAKH